MKSGVAECVGFTPDKPGMYRVRVRAGDSPATGEVWFGVFPQRDRRLRPDSMFGTHVTAVVPEPTNTLLASEAMGARWVRLHDFGDFCHWRVVEPEKGRFEWRDAEIDDLRNRGFMILANLGHPPLWAGRPHPAGAGPRRLDQRPPRDVAEWENYVFKTVEHFRGRIRHWEVWNEPCWQGFFSGTPEEYAELLKVAYRAIKRADPQAVVIGGCFSSHAAEWTKRVLAQDGLDFMDALSYHVYWSPAVTEPAAPGEPTFIEQEVRHFVDLMRERGQAQTDLHDRGRPALPAVRLVAAEGGLQPRRGVRLAARCAARLDRPRRSLRPGARHGADAFRRRDQRLLLLHGRRRGRDALVLDDGQRLLRA